MILKFKNDKEEESKRKSMRIGEMNRKMKKERETIRRNWKKQRKCMKKMRKE